MNDEKTQSDLIELLSQAEEVPYAKECADEIDHGRLIKEYAGRKLANAGHLARIYSIRAKLSKRDSSIEGIENFVINLEKTSPDKMIAFSEVASDQTAYSVFTDLKLTELFGLIRIDLFERKRSGSFYDKRAKAFF